MPLLRRTFLGLIGGGLGGSVALAACGRFGGSKGGGSGDGGTSKGPTIGMLQFVDAAPPNAVRQGFVDTLAKGGYVDGRSARLIARDAAGELPNTTLVVKQFLSTPVDMILAIGTPPLQAAIKEAPATLPVVFCYCSNPWGAGAGTSLTEHLPNVVGTVGTNPLGQELDLALRITPGLKDVGLIFNPGEPNSSFEAELMQKEAGKRGLTVKRQAVASSGEVLQAAQALARQGVGAFVKIGDYATIQAFSSICKVGLASRIPVYSVDPPDIQILGCLGVIGWTYFDDGAAAAELAIRVLKGESPATIPFEPLTKTRLLLNRATAKAIDVKLPAAVLSQADSVVG